MEVYGQRPGVYCQRPLVLVLRTGRHCQKAGGFRLGGRRGACCLKTKQIPPPAFDYTRLELINVTPRTRRALPKLTSGEHVLMGDNANDPQFVFRGAEKTWVLSDGF